MTLDLEQLDPCADLLDAAANLTLASTATQVAHLSHLAAPEQIQNEDGSWPETECVDCGCDIEEGRLNLGKVRCLRCQETLEKKRRGNFRVSQ